MNPLYKKALLKADEVRMQLGLNMFQPINIFDSCIHLGLSVRFVNVNMEGMYIKHEDESQPTILLSNQRPLPRRIYTCGHELGHHVFGHGSKLDALSDVSDYSTSQNDNDEFLVDSFAGALLMPIAGVKSEFAKRNWSLNSASAIQFYTVSSVFGTGYQTLITHCKTNSMIYKNQADALIKFTPAKIFKSLTGTETDKSFFKIIDDKSNLSVIDLEVFNYIILPKETKIEGDHLKKYKDTAFGIMYVATKPGILRAVCSYNGLNYFIRIQNSGYIGLAEYRHLENESD